jgi:transposase
VHETYDVRLPEACPTCGEGVRETQVAAQYQEDLPPVQPVVRRFDIHTGTCVGCQRRVQGRHPLQTSDALGAARVQLGPHAITLAVQLNKQSGVSFGKIATLFRERFGLLLHGGPAPRPKARSQSSS